MDAPIISYVKASDGIRLAVGEVGRGPPLVVLPEPFSNIELQWRSNKRFRSFIENLGQDRRLILWDARGTGSSQRDVENFSLEDLYGDMCSVVDYFQLGRFSVLGYYHCGLSAVMYAARNPERVDRLVLWHVYRKYEDLIANPQFEAVRGLQIQDWRLWTETAAMTTIGWSGPEVAREYAAEIRASIDPGSFRIWFNETRHYDITQYLPLIRTPTLVVHRRNSPRYPLAIAQKLAADISGARLRVLEGEGSYYYLENQEEGLAAIRDFLDIEHAGSPDFAPLRAWAGLRTLLFTDIEGHTSMMQRLGDERGRAVLREHERISREALRHYGGTEIKTIGDSFMASFPSAQMAVQCAIALQRAFLVSDCAGEKLRIRIGINAGEPIADDNDLFGSSVILAARTKEKADGGQILVTDVVRQLLAGKDFLFTDVGHVEMKGFDEPIRLFEVAWTETKP